MAGTKPGHDEKQTGFFIPSCSQNVSAARAPKGKSLLSARESRRNLRLPDDGSGSVGPATKAKLS